MFDIALSDAGKIDQHSETSLWSVVEPGAENVSCIVIKYQARVQSQEAVMVDKNVNGVWIISANNPHADLIALRAAAKQYFVKSRSL